MALKVNNRIEFVKDLLNSNVLVIFNDGDKVTRRKGRILTIDDNFIYILNERSGSYEAIALRNVIRIEFSNSKR